MNEEISARQNIVEVFFSDDFTNANNLISGFKHVWKASGWKRSTQKFKLNLLREIYNLQKELRNKTYKQSRYNSFILNEHGRLRNVKALIPRDMTVNHSLCDTILNPTLRERLIYDNGACLKGKGISFTRRRFEEHLKWHYRRYGNEGYILKIDFRKYFDNIDHNVLKQKISQYLKDPDVLHLLSVILDANKVDISFSDDPNYADQVFDSLAYNDIDKSLLTKKRFMEKSMGVGVPTAQISGLFLPTPIDTYCKTVKGLHCYDAYMDDRIIIHRDKEFLKRLLNEIKEIAKTLKIHINEKKTQIIKISHGFTFLKTRYILTDTGKIIKLIPRKVVTRQRRKMKKLARFVMQGKMKFKDFELQYKSWRGGKDEYNAQKTLRNLDKLFKQLKQEITNKKETLN